MYFVHSVRPPKAAQQRSADYYCCPCFLFLFLLLLVVGGGCWVFVVEVRQVLKLTFFSLPSFLVVVVVVLCGFVVVLMVETDAFV